MARQLREEEQYRVRTLWFDARMTYEQIVKATGYSEMQIRTALAKEILDPLLLFTADD